MLKTFYINRDRTINLIYEIATASADKFSISNARKFYKMYLLCVLIFITSNV